MKILLAVTALGLCTLAPAISACEYDDATSASATAPAQVGLAPAPQASRTAANVVKGNVQKTAAKAPTKAKVASDKVAVANPR